MVRTIFSTPTILDLEMLQTFGVSVKETENPIGQFGTGLKYALAILMREGCKVDLHIDGHLYEVGTERVEMRGRPFHVVTMNGERLPFTTELGKHWELWQAFRELYSNTMDEEGGCWVAEHDADGTLNETVIVVESEDFAKIALDKGTVFLNGEPMLVSDSLDVHDEETNHVFNRGIRVAEFEKPLLHTYNIKDKVSLTEDRTLRNASEVDSHIIASVVKSEDEDYIEKVITAPDTHHEHGLDFRYHIWLFGKKFREVMVNVIKQGRAQVNPTLVRVYDEERVKEEKAKDLTVRRFKVTLSQPNEITDSSLADDIQTAIKENLGLDCEVNPVK